jgi:hypothetical protein
MYDGSNHSRSKSYGGDVKITKLKDQEEFVEDTVEQNIAEPLGALKKLIGKTDLIITKEGDLYKGDFDKLNLTKNEGVLSADTSQPPTKKIKKLSMKLRNKHSSEDITPEQVEENYWHETKMTKLDGSTAMMEARISKCMEATGKSYEECAKEVKPRMKKAGSENTNTEDIEEVEDTEDTEDNKDKTEVCSKELDMLREKAKKFDDMKKDFETIQEDMSNKVKDLESYVDDLKAKEAVKMEKKVEKRIKKFSEDFLKTEEEIKEKIGDRKGQKILDYLDDARDWIEGAGIKAQSKEVEETAGYDVESFKTDFEKLREEAYAKLRHD